MRAKNEFKFISEAYKNVHEEETDEQIRRRGGHGDKDDPEWKRQMDNRPEVSPEEVERLKNRKPKPQSYSKKHPKSGDDVISQLDVEAAARERLRKKYGEDNEEPRRGISGYEHKPDALVSARQAGAKHKPYVSSFVSDGGKIFGVMGSDGKIVHKTRDKQKAYKWFRDNYDNI